MAITHARRAQPAAPGRDLTVLPRPRPSAEPLEVTFAGPEFRDQLTRTYLRTLPEAPQAADVIAFRPRWWDGSARVPALLVRLPDGPRHRRRRPRRRCRVVESGGRVLALPASSWRARRALRRLRRPAVVDPALRLLRRPDLLAAAPPRVDVLGDCSDRPVGRPTPPALQRAGTRTEPTRVVSVRQGGDVLRCPHPGCAGLVPVPPPGRVATAEPRCPSCGRT